MRFEFKPSEHSKSFKEYSQHSSNISLVNDIYKKCIIIPVATIIFAMVISSLKGIYKNTVFYSIVFVIGVILVTLFVVVVSLFMKLFKRKVKNNKMYCDLESTFYFTIEDSYILRENEFSTIKVAVNNIEKIKLLKYGVVLCAQGENMDMFIPKDILPISIQELIEVIRYENSTVIIDEAAKREKKRLRKYYLIIFIVSLFAAVSAYFVDKYDYEHNFTRYELVMSNELNVQENQTLLYSNNNLGFSLVFPSKWDGKFGIEELEDRVNVYYLAKGKQSPKTTILFSIRKIDYKDDHTGFNVIKREVNDNGFFTFLGPKTIYTLERGTDESLEYNKLYIDIESIKLK